MKKNKNLIQWFLVVGIAIGLIASFVFKEAEFSKENIEEVKKIKIGGEELRVELATTLEARTQGLSYRATLAEGDSMLFVFDQPGFYSFWMKDMNFPIDIIWIDEDLRVVYIKENAEPSSYPEAFTPSKKALYVLETVSGFSSENSLKEGDKVELSH